MIVVSEIDLESHEHLRYFRFPLDGDKQFCYRSRVSYNAFVGGTKRRNYAPNYKNARFLYACGEEEEKLVYSDVPIIDVGSLWEFYAAIGYDYKTKRYRCR